MNRIVAATIFIALSGCATTTTPARIYLGESGGLHYEGELTEGAVADLISMYEHATPRPDTLYISSPGGDVSAGMNLGEWIHAHDVNVHVVEGCASSCANYVFPAGKRKELEMHSVLFWHGGMYQRGLDNNLADEGRDALHELREREDRFFERIGVDGRITTCGQPAQWFLNESRTVPYVGFDYSLEGLKRLGIENVYLADGEWNWRNREREYDVLRVRVVGSGHDLRCEAE